MSSPCHAVKPCFVLLFTLRWQGERGEEEEGEEKRGGLGQEVLRVADSFSFRHMLWLLPWVPPSLGAFVFPLHDSLSPDCISRLQLPFISTLLWALWEVTDERSTDDPHDAEWNQRWTLKEELFTSAGWQCTVTSVCWGIWRGKRVPTSPFISVKLRPPQWHESSILYSWHNRVSRLAASKRRALLQLCTATEWKRSEKQQHSFNLLHPDFPH